MALIIDVLAVAMLATVAACDPLDDCCTLNDGRCPERDTLGQFSYATEGTPVSSARGEVVGDGDVTRVVTGDGSLIIGGLPLPATDDARVNVSGDGRYARVQDAAGELLFEGGSFEGPSSPFDPVLFLPEVRGEDELEGAYCRFADSGEERFQIEVLPLTDVRDRVAVGETRLATLDARPIRVFLDAAFFFRSRPRASDDVDCGDECGDTTEGFFIRAAAFSTE